MAPLKFSVHLTVDAATDLDEVLTFIELRESEARADHVYEHIAKSILKLESAPHRGRVVPELRSVGVTEYREVFWKPYRILFFVEDRTVYVVAIFDGRRDLADILMERLLR